MSREIKFRGKCIETGEFVFGLLTQGFTKSTNFEYIGPSIIFYVPDNGMKTVEVMPGTIGQYTEKRDRFGNEIFEGDILRWVSTNPFSLNEVREVEVYYIEAHYWCKGKNLGVYLGELLSEEKIEVIGNIHEAKVNVTNKIKDL